METILSALPAREQGASTVVKGIWGGSRSFLLHIVLVVLVALFMKFYVDGRTFFLAHNLTLQQANGTITHERVVPPVQSDITTIISLLASTARAASTFWIAGIDLRCIFLFMQRGGVSFEGLQSMFGRSLPGRHHFWQKTNYAILLILHGGVFASTYTSSILAGSVTWRADRLYRPGQPINAIPLGQTGDGILNTVDSRFLETFVGYSSAIYSAFYASADNRNSRFMHRLTPDSVRYLTNGSSFAELTVPFFAVDKFEWITDPNSVLTDHQKNITIATNTSGPRVMNLRKWGFLPDGNWGPYEKTFPAPLTVSGSRVLVISGEDEKCNFGRLNSTIPSNIQPYVVTFNTRPLCFIFANVTFRAGAARSRRCQMSGTGVLQDYGSVTDLLPVDDPVTSAALAILPYVATSLYETGYAIPTLPAFPTMQTASIEILSRSYQVSWNGLTSLYGSNTESSPVEIAVNASTASVLMWRVALWGVLHGILVTFGFLFKFIHTRGRYPWIEDPVTAALLIDPTSLMNDPRTWAGKDAPHIAGMLKLEQKGTSTYLVLEEANRDAENKV